MKNRLCSGGPSAVQSVRAASDRRIDFAYGGDDVICFAAGVFGVDEDAGVAAEDIDGFGAGVGTVLDGLAAG